MDTDQSLNRFIAESRKSLAEMHYALRTLMQVGGEAQPLDGICHAVRRINGSTGLAGLGRIATFTQVLESLLDKVRAGELSISNDMANLLLESTDHIGALLNALELGVLDSDVSLHAQCAPLTRRLMRCLGTACKPATSSRMQFRSRRRSA